MRLKEAPEDFRVEERLAFAPGPRGPFAVYRVEKRGIDTPTACERIASVLRLDVADVRAAGLKDRVAEAVQHVSVRVGARGVPAEVRAGGLRAQRLGYAERALRSQDIAANRFVLGLGGLAPALAEALPTRLALLVEHGLPNYFDDQRFGGESPARGYLADRLERGEVWEAVTTFLTEPTPKDGRSDRLERERIRDGLRDAGPLASADPGRLRSLAERAVGETEPVLRTLADFPDEPEMALRALPTPLRVLLIARAQAQRWNDGVAARLKDLVPKAERYQLMNRSGALVFWRTASEELRARLSAWREPYVSMPRAAAILEARDDEEPGERSVWLRPEEPSLGEVVPDEGQPGKLRTTLRVTLPRGAYATLVAKCLCHADAAPRR